MSYIPTDEEYKKSWDENAKRHDDWFNKKRIERFIHNEEIKTWREGIAKDLSEEEFTKMINDIAKDREAEKMKQFMTVEELYKKLGNLMVNGHSKDFVRIDSEDFSYIATKDMLDKIKPDNEFNIVIEV